MFRDRNNLGIILPKVTKMVVQALGRNVYHTKVQNLVIFMDFKPFISIINRVLHLHNIKSIIK